MSKPRVSYFYDDNIGSYYYGQQHPMKPIRVKLTHNLLLNFKLYRKMTVFTPHIATADEIKAFHSNDYIDFLEMISPSNERRHKNRLTDYGLSEQITMKNLGDGPDCPVFEGMFDYCRSYTGGTIDGATQLNHGTTDIAVNYSGGLHHAKKTEASGFCYVNDIVLGILELLKYHARVLYIDIDVHHGDGVEEAFYTTDRVLTCSFHQFGDFFPGTGDHTDIGHKAGRNYAVNFPLESGIRNRQYTETVFKPVISKIVEFYRPGAIVLQCGADSIASDRIGSFNLTLKGHGECVNFVKSLGLPLLVLGGGGYVPANVARCWAYEASVLLDRPLKEDTKIPYHDFLQWYEPYPFKLHLDPIPELKNKNSKKYINGILTEVLKNIKQLQHAPSAQIKDVPDLANIYSKRLPEDAMQEDDEEVSVEGAASTRTGVVRARRAEHDSEMYD